MQSVARIFTAVIAVYIVATMLVFALLSLPDGDPAQDFLLGNRAWVREAKYLNRTIDPRLNGAVRYAIWLGRVTRSLILSVGPTAAPPQVLPSAGL
jgi:hypothetical protein